MTLTSQHGTLINTKVEKKMTHSLLLTALSVLYTFYARTHRLWNPQADSGFSILYLIKRKQQLETQAASLFDYSVPHCKPTDTTVKLYTVNTRSRVREYSLIACIFHNLKINITAVTGPTGHDSLLHTGGRCPLLKMRSTQSKMKLGWRSEAAARYCCIMNHVNTQRINHLGVIFYRTCDVTSPQLNLRSVSNSLTRNTGTLTHKVEVTCGLWKVLRPVVACGRCAHVVVSPSRRK